ncbi:MAG: isoprenyl transferase [Omnitrophica bacterium]|nr:isoprenyl transferase [Candidatus Omnitrophota bacterium]
MRIPYHIAVIMDGNGRWAKKRGLPRILGHRKGVNRVKEIVLEAKKQGVKVLTIFAFSTENWSRPKKELNILFSYLDRFLDAYKKELIKNDIKVNIIGRKDRLEKRLIDKMNDLEDATKDNKSFIFNIALDYGGRWDILEATKKIAKACCDKKISQEDIDEEFFGRYLVLNGIGDPDLLIRTSGEQRISNFLIWNLAYTELYFTPVFWPAFDKKELAKAIEVYSKRDRRFGGAGD